MTMSRQATGRPLLTPGEVMQLPPDEELVMVAGHPPLRARKLRYYADRNFTSRVLSPPVLSEYGYSDRPDSQPDDWGGQVIAAPESVESDSEPAPADVARWLPGDDVRDRMLLWGGRGPTSTSSPSRHAGWSAWRPRTGCRCRLCSGVRWRHSFRPMPSTSARQRSRGDWTG